MTGSPAPSGEAMPAVDALAEQIAGVLREHSGERAIVDSIAEILDASLAGGFDIPERFKRASPDHYVMYPLYIAPDESFCIASAVWGVGQVTPIHDHGVWGVVGILEGVEQEERFNPPDVAGPLEAFGHEDFSPGEVTICCTTDRDLHRVRAGGDDKCVGIHIYGGDIWKVRRRAYDQNSGKVSYFVSSPPAA